MNLNSDPHFGYLKSSGVLWAGLYAAVKLAAPQVFGPLPAAEESDYVKKRVEIVTDLVQKQGASFERTNPGELFHLETAPYLELLHPVDSFVRKY